MEIHSLKLTITEQDLNDLAKKHLPEDQPVEDLHIHLASEGIYLKGVYPLFVNVSFEMLWVPAISEDKVSLQLTSLRAMGMPGNIFKSAVLKVVGDLSKGQDWLQIQNDLILLDLERLLAKNGLPARTNLKMVTCQTGMLVVEASQ